MFPAWRLNGGFVRELALVVVVSIFFPPILLFGFFVVNPRELQQAVNPAGIRVLSVKLNDLTYAPEISQAMLMRQQALALIDARKTIVEGAVGIVHDAVERLRAAGLEVSPAQKEVLISNLLVVLCSGEHAQPVLQVQASQKP